VMTVEVSLFDHLKAKRQVRLHNRALDHVRGAFDKCLGAFLDGTGSARPFPVQNRSA
jgi:hypothetical protein